MKFEIKNRWSGALIFSIETDNWRLAVEAAVKSKANLSYADLSYADLRSANLSYADLRSADLRSANLSYANLSSADLSYADLRSANLSYADLRSADLSYANLSSANLSYGEETLKMVGDRPYLCIGPIGSRADYLQSFITDHGVFVRAGCFWDSLKTFKKAVKETHLDNEHAKEYVLAIKLIEFHAKQYGAK